jgi:uncharacterized membrane protein (UPF0127 family)
MLYSRSAKRKLAENVRVASGFFGRFMGLMFERRKHFDYALVFDFGTEKRAGASIHMLFVFFPIDAVYLDSSQKVVDIARLTPFSLNYTPKRKARFLIEMPAGTAGRIKEGDELEWHPPKA